MKGIKTINTSALQSTFNSNTIAQIEVINDYSWKFIDLGQKLNLPAFPIGSQVKIGQNKRRNNMVTKTFSYHMDMWKCIKTLNTSAWESTYSNTFVQTEVFQELKLESLQTWSQTKSTFFLKGSQVKIGQNKTVDLAMIYQVIELFIVAEILEKWQK